MRKNDILKCGDSIFRVLDIKNNEIFLIDCGKRTIPTWISEDEIQDCTYLTEKELKEYIPIPIPDFDTMDAKSLCIINERYTLISGILPIVSDFRMRNKRIAAISAEYGICRQTIINYLCLYLAFQDKAVLAPKPCISDTTLSHDEKNFRWAINKFYLNQNKNSLRTAYTLMLKEKYCDCFGVLHPDYPSFNRFRYFYRKNKKLQTYYISRNGIKDYQKNHRLLLGDGVQEFAPAVGVGFLDSTVCDVYIVNEAGNVIGRPLLTTCIDAYSSLCCGYSLSWEGGVYSLRGLMLNIITNKQELCKKHGIIIEKSEWDCDMLPGTLVTDRGSEYISETFEQLADVGIRIINLPSFRADLKSEVERFFGLIQDSFKPYLKGKGIVMPDYQERGARDYRKDACLTMEDFEKVLIRCIIYYNSQRILENFPYTEDMIKDKIQPFSNSIWNYGKSQNGANLIKIDKEILTLTLLPRTIGKFRRNGLIVNKMRYKNRDFIEEYLSGGTVKVAYNPDDVSNVWLIKNGSYIRFELIESRYAGKQLLEVQQLQEEKKSLVQAAETASIQAQIDLAAHILNIADNAIKHENTDVKGIRETRKRETRKTHINYMKEGEPNE